MAASTADFPNKTVTDEWRKIADVTAYFGAEASDVNAVIEELGGTGSDDISILAAIDPTFVKEAIAHWARTQKAKPMRVMRMVFIFNAVRVATDRAVADLVPQPPRLPEVVPSPPDQGGASAGPVEGAPDAALPPGGHTAAGMSPKQPVEFENKALIVHGTDLADSGGACPGTPLAADAVRALGDEPLAPAAGELDGGLVRIPRVITDTPYRHPGVITTLGPKKSMVPAFSPMVSLCKIIDQSMDQDIPQTVACNGGSARMGWFTCVPLASMVATTLRRAEITLATDRLRLVALGSRWGKSQGPAGKHSTSWKYWK